MTSMNEEEHKARVADASRRVLESEAGVLAALGKGIDDPTWTEQEREAHYRHVRNREIADEAIVARRRSET